MKLCNICKQPVQATKYEYRDKQQDFRMQISFKRPNSNYPEFLCIRCLVKQLNKLVERLNKELGI